MSAYQHLIGGCVGDVPHEPGDRVDPRTDQAKLEEWLAAGLVAVIDTPKSPVPKKRKARDDHDIQHTDPSPADGE
jgi:hypothetical protein